MAQKRGLRQGCNGSPPDFLIFINDLLTECRQNGYGAKLPQEKEDREDWQAVPPGTNGNAKTYYFHKVTKEVRWTMPDSTKGYEGEDFVDKFVGLLFADDAVAFAGDHVECQQMADMLGQWAKINRMEFGISKCAVLLIPGGKGSHPIPQITMLNPTTGLRENVPLLATYKYLGLQFNVDLSLDDMISWRAERVQKKILWPMRKMLGNKNIALSLRRHAIIGLLLPALCYGGELFGLTSVAANNNRIQPLERVLKHALAMIGRASYRTDQNTPSGTSDAILREELCVPSVEATMAGQAVRARIKYQDSPGLVSWLIKSRPQTGAGNGAWPGTMETKAHHVSAWFGLNTTNTTNTNSDDSAAKQTVAHLGDLPETIKDAVAGGPMNKAMFDDAEANTSQLEGRRMRDMANEWHFRRTTCPTTNDYATSGLRQSAKAFLTLTGLHPNLAAGFHHLATARNGSFQTWRQVCQQKDRDSYKYQIGSKIAAGGCPCCNSNAVADSLGHFIFECRNTELTKIRKDLQIKEFAQMLTAEVTRQQSNRNNNSSTTTTAAPTNNPTNHPSHAQGNQRVTRSVTTSQAETMATLLVGRRLDLQSTGNTTGTSTSQSISVFDLQNWQQVKGNANHAALKKAVDEALDYQLSQKKQKKKKKIQIEHPLFESSTVILARYLQLGFQIRSNVFWKNNSSRRSNVGQS